MAARHNSPASDLQEDFLPVEEIKEQPAGHHDADRPEDGLRRPKITNESVHENSGNRFKFEEMPDQVNGDGVDADDGEEKGPAPVAPHVNDPVEERQQEQAPAAREEYEGAGPNVLDDGEIETPDDGHPQACDTRERKAQGFAVGRTVRAQPVSGQDARERRADGGKGGEDSFIVAESETTIRVREEMAVNEAGQVALGRYHAGAEARNGNQHHQRPVAQQNSAQNVCLAAHAGVHDDERRDKVTDRDALEDSGNAQVVKVEIEQVVVNEAQQKEQNQTPDEVAVKLGAVRTRFQAFGQGEGQHRSDHEDEERKDKVIEMKAGPGHVLELRVEGIRGGAGQRLVDGVDDFLATGDPEHVESAQRVNGSDTLLEKGLRFCIISHKKLLNSCRVKWRLDCLTKSTSVKAEKQLITAEASGFAKGAAVAGFGRAVLAFEGRS